MNMTDPSSIKYQVKAKITADGIVDKPDVVGAIFGQTEGLLGDNLDLRDLQKSGRIGRVEVEIVSKGGKSEGIIYMSSSLDQVETAIISATLETIDRVGPCKASIKVIGIEDIRVTKREQIAERAKELLGVLMEQAKGSGSNLTQNIRESLQVEEITTYGKERCPAGPTVKNSEAIIIVEGRSDVLNLLRAGIKNAIAVEGTNIPKSVQDLSKERVTTAFVDGDRGGELILRELFQTADIDYVARAPRSQEVEELSAKQLVKCLRNKIPGDQYMEMNKLSFEEKELSEDAENDMRESRARSEEPEEEPRFRIRKANDEDEDDSRFSRNRRDRHTRRNAEEMAEEEGRFARGRRERFTRRNADEETEEEPRSDRRRDRHTRRNAEEMAEELEPRRRERRDRESRRVIEEEPEYADETPDTESVITETEDGEIVVEEVEIAEEQPVEEPAAVEEPVAEEAPAEEPVKEEAPAEEPVAEEPAKEEEPAEEEVKKPVRAPRGKKAKAEKILTEEQEALKAVLSEISGTRNSVLMDSEGNTLDKVEVKNLANYLKDTDKDNIATIVFDGVISQNILDISSGKGIKTLVGKNKGKISKLPAELTVWTRTDLL